MKKFPPLWPRKTKILILLLSLCIFTTQAEEEATTPKTLIVLQNDETTYDTNSTKDTFANNDIRSTLYPSPAVPSEQPIKKQTSLLNHFKNQLNDLEKQKKTVQQQIDHAGCDFQKMSFHQSQDMPQDEAKDVLDLYITLIKKLENKKEVEDKQIELLEQTIALVIADSTLSSENLLANAKSAYVNNFKNVPQLDKLISQINELEKEKHQYETNISQLKTFIAQKDTSGYSSFCTKSKPLCLAASQYPNSNNVLSLYAQNQTRYKKPSQKKPSSSHRDSSPNNDALVSQYQNLFNLYEQTKAENQKIQDNLVESENKVKKLEDTIINNPLTDLMASLSQEEQHAFKNITNPSQYRKFLSTLTSNYKKKKQDFEEKKHSLLTMNKELISCIRLLLPPSFQKDFAYSDYNLQTLKKSLADAVTNHESQYALAEIYEKQLEGLVKQANKMHLIPSSLPYYFKRKEALLEDLVKEQQIGREQQIAQNQKDDEQSEKISLLSQQVNYLTTALQKSTQKAKYYKRNSRAQNENFAKQLQEINLQLLSNEEEFALQKDALLDYERENQMLVKEIDQLHRDMDYKQSDFNTKELSFNQTIQNLQDKLLEANTTMTANRNDMTLQKAKELSLNQTIKNLESKLSDTNATITAYQSDPSSHHAKEDYENQIEELSTMISNYEKVLIVNNRELEALKDQNYFLQEQIAKSNSQQNSIPIAQSQDP